MTDVTLEYFTPSKGRNKNKKFPMIAISDGSKYSKRISVSKAKLVISHLEAIKKITEESLSEDQHD